MKHIIRRKTVTQREDSVQAGVRDEDDPLPGINGELLRYLTAYALSACLPNAPTSQPYIMAP